MKVKKSILKLSGGILRAFYGLFYKSQYLKGRWFEESYFGWLMAWRCMFSQKLFGYNRQIPWPVASSVRISGRPNIKFNIDDMQNFWSFGVYYQTLGGHIKIGKGTYIGPNVGLITSNHEFENLDNHNVGADIEIGDNCWIGMNSIVLPGVYLANRTIVGAGSVVTKSFEKGNCVIAGNPAKFIKEI